MKTRLTIALAILLCPATLPAQKLLVKPFAGYYSPRLGNVNSTIDNQMNSWRDFIGEPLPVAGNIGAETLFGGALQTRLRNGYFASIDVARYRGSSISEYTTTAIPESPDFFLFSREVEFLTVSLGVQYYFDYTELAAWHFYLNIGAGMMKADAVSETRFTYTANSLTGAQITPVDTKGEFSGTILTGSLAAGATHDLAGPVSVWGEAGIRFGNFGQLEGSIQRAGTPTDDNALTDSTFDLGGLFARVGLGIALIQ